MTEVAKEFVTPDRAPHQSGSIEEKQDAENEGMSEESTKQPKTVTPHELSSASREGVAGTKEARDSSFEGLVENHEGESPEDRKVRFDKGDQGRDSVADSPSSMGSQRGLVSRRGGRCASPGRMANPSPKKEPVLEFKAYRSPQRKKDATDSVPSLSSDISPEKGRKATMKKEDGAGSSSTAENKGSGPLSTGPNGTRKAKSGERKSNVTFSPVPPPREATRTPTRSPTGGRFQSLPVLDDDTLKSPGSFFLSPHPPTPSSRILKENGSFDKEKDEEKPAAGQPMPSPKTPRSPRTPRRDDRDRFLTTPTDFAMDYGKHTNTSSFDSSNVLAWLQSPTANGLFSPGGFGSMLNTPKGAPRTPRTPTVSTSFFFSDVAGLPGNEHTSPKGNEKKGSRGVSNIICISPLASSKAQDSSGYTPTINYKDMFASPEKSRGLPLLEDSPLNNPKDSVSRSGGKHPNVDAVHMVERELMEDEDLSVLLQLASSTPKRNGERPVAVSTSEGTRVFQSPKERNVENKSDENLPSLQLPIIGGRDGQSNATKLARKTHSRDHGDGSDNFHRPMGVRSPSPAVVNSSVQAKRAESKKDDKRKDSSKPDGSKAPPPPKTTSMHPPHPGYMAPHHYHPDAPHYYPHMPPGMSAHNGSMRVVVGGPRTKNSPPRSPHGRAYPMGDPNYPPPYGRYPHHPHGMPPPHMHHYYPPPPQHPPPRHMPMYGAQQPPPGKAKLAAKPAKQISAKASSKRPLPNQAAAAKPTSAKKSKKASPPGSTKKKNRSPQSVEKPDRHKSAAGTQANGGKNDKAAALAAAILRGVTMRPSGKWQAQLYFAGKSRYIGVFDTREKAALAYEIAREKLKAEKQSAEGGTLSPKATEAAVNAARKAAFEGVNDSDPRV